MKLFEHLERIEKFKKYLEQSKTGTPNEFARKIGVSRSSLYELIDELRSRGAPILYSKSSKTFYYEKPFEISITCKLKPIKDEDQKNYSGGTYLSRILFFRTLQSDLSTVTLPC